MKILLYLAIGLTIGGLSGTLGIGGGVLMVPALIWLLHLEQQQAQGITLAILALPVVVPGVWEYYARGLIKQPDLVVAAWIAGGFAVGAFAGAWVLAQDYLPIDRLRLLFGLLMIYVAVRFILHSHSEAANAAGGLVAVAVAWLGYWALRLLGRRHLARPDLGKEIRRLDELGPDKTDYYI